MKKEVTKEKTTGQRCLPNWLRVRWYPTPNFQFVRRTLKAFHTYTVCEEARCPNRMDCYHRLTTTFLILGDRCTRRCRYCGVHHDAPRPLDPAEPERVADAAAALGLRYVVITSVTRDDLADGGARHFAKTIQAVKRRIPGVKVEILVPDFLGNHDALSCVLETDLDVFSHNLETVPRLYPTLRPGADFERSFRLLKTAKQRHPHLPVKTGLMVGLGESEDEMNAVFSRLAEIGCDVLTIGQYLRPNLMAYPVVAYLPPAVFHAYAEKARACGIRSVYSGPLVRSSYHAETMMREVAREHDGNARSCLSSIPRQAGADF